MPIDPPALGPLLGNTVNTIISPFYTLFSTNATYCFTARTNVQNHRTETETLEGDLLRVEQRITDGERNGLIPTDEAESWVQRANRAISEETANRESFDKRCRIFGCSLSCWGNYKTSKQAAEKVDDVRKCISSTPATDNITRVPPPPPVIDFSTHSIQLLPSREDTLQHALTCIKDDLTVGVIGIWGPDRDEKTHLLKKINNSFLGGCPFDFVIFLTASSECSVQNIQAQITKRLRINQLDDVATQATRISELLRTKTFLLLVDDLRVQLDLQAVGIPYPLGDVEVVAVAQDSEIVEAVQDGGVSCKLKRKVVITSISQPICLLMDADRYIPVPDLGEGEARQLFAKEFGAPLDSNAEALVRELKGLPSDLIRYGKLMQGITDVRQWEVAIDAVRKANLQRNDPLNLAEKIVRNVENATKDLDAKGNDVCREIADAELQCKTPTNEVKRWLEKVEKLCEAVRVISADCRLLKKDVTMLASEMLRDVQECLSTCPSTVAVESMPPPVQEMPGPSISVGNHNLEVALQYIEDDPTVGMIGIWGPRGVGKTHILTKINNSFIEYCPFDIVIIIKASSECAVEKVQDQIINRFSINQNVNVTTQIYELLKKRSFLVMVDDLCEKLDLSAVGIPYPLGVVDEKNRKVVIMSRSQQVCDLMGVDKYIEVQCLEETEALQLFEQSFGEENLYNDPHIGVLAKGLVRELMGIPSELIHFGNIMRRRRNAKQWEVVIDAVKRSNLQKDNPLCMGERIVGNLEDSTKDLVAKRNDVSQKIENSEREGKISTNEVNRWLDKMAKVVTDVQAISLDCKQLKKDVTMEASQKLREVQECLNSCPSIVSVESMPRPVQEMPGPSMSVDNPNLKLALQYIKDDPTVGIIGIWGPGGVGKTHLLKNINNSLGEGMSLNFVLFITASRGCSVEKVQSQIIERLGLKITGSESKIRSAIYEYMKAKSFVILLDDLWEHINLEDVGIPYPLGNVANLKRKVVLTTRLRKVCGQMEVRKELKVPYLQEHEAWLLFEKNIGVETLSSPYIEALARELMKELKGLPLALTTIGKAMYRRDTAQWETAIQYMQQSCCTDDNDPIELGMETNVFRQLKFSYDNLRSKTLKDCFLTCALWPEDARIPKLFLAQCWMGLGLVNKQNIESSFRKSYSLIADLTAVCLLEDIEDSYGFIKVHDVIRDMAVWICSDCGENNDKWIVRAPAGEDNKFIIPWNKAEYISLMSSRLTELDPIGFNPDPIKLRILCLQGNIFDEIVVAEAIKNCSSLTYLDLSSNGLRSIPEGLCSFEKLEYLNLSENELQVTELPRSIGNLINLKFLYLTNTGIRTIPSEVISRLKALQVIDLRTIWELYGSTVREPYLKGRAYFNLGVQLFREFGTLPQLKALGIIAIGFDEFDSLMLAANLPLRYLTLIQLDKLCLSDLLLNYFARRTLYDLVITSCEDLEEIIVRHDTRQPNNHFGSLNQLSMILMPELKEITWIGATPASILPRLTYLELCSCDSLLHISWVMYLPRLEQLLIQQCERMVQAFMRCHGDTLCNVQEKKITFPCLKFLDIQGNRSLDTIGDNGMEFPSLERLVLCGCPKVKRLPFQLDSLPQKLKELTFLDVEDWEELECEEGVKSFLQPTLKFGLHSDFYSYKRR